MAARQAEDVMILLVDPAALGGLAGLIAVASWAVGRAHGPLAGEGWADRGEGAGTAHPVPGSPAPDRQFGAPSAPTSIMRAPCQQRALEERRAALARPFVLAELHAEASAIRRDERILGHVPCEDALIVLTRHTSGAECRFIGLSGQPTCPGTTRLACPDSAACHEQHARGPRRVLPDPV